MDDKAELRDTFDHFDTNGDGHIDLGEFRRLLEDGLSAEMPADEMKLGFEVIDKDGNGTIEFNEFAAWWRDR